MFFKSAIIEGFAKIGLAPNSRLANARRERDLAIAELKAIQEGKYDYIQATLNSLTQNAMPSESSGIRHTARSMISAKNAMN